MFTGIVSSLGTVTNVAEAGPGRVLQIEANAAADGLAVGDSIAINGVCLTAVRVDGGRFTVDVMAETVMRSNLGSLVEGSTVNLERPVAAAGRLDGHIVQGHVDGVGVVRSVTPEGESWRVWVDLSPDLMRFVVEKGSIAVDGVSLTVTGVDQSGFEIALIPHTLEVTVWGERDAGDQVNVEVDILAKYVERLVEAYR